MGLLSRLKGFRVGEFFTSIDAISLLMRKICNSTHLDNLIKWAEYINQIGRQKQLVGDNKVTLCSHGSSTASPQAFRDFYTVCLSARFFTYSDSGEYKPCIRRPERAYLELAENEGYWGNSY